jgi:hypothetical protein
MQAEAEFVAFIYSHNADAVGRARHNAEVSVLEWQRAQAELKQHQTSHQFQSAA